MIKYFFILNLMIITSIYGQSAKDVAKNVIPSTVLIISQDINHQTMALGSGFVIEDNIIVTNRHVVEGASYGYILLNGKSTKYTIIGYLAVDDKNDLILLSVNQFTGPVLTLSNENSPSIGEKIFAVGNPNGLTGTISEGIISGLRDYSGSNLIQITAPISPGSSGGPIVMSNSSVIGIAVGGVDNGQNLNFAIPVSSLKSLLLQKNSVKQLSTLNKIKKTNTTNSITTDITEFIKIRNIKYRASDQFESVFVESGQMDNDIVEFSILNNLDKPIKNIKLLFIVYDNTNTPVDYVENTFFTSSPGPIKPHLALTNKGQIGLDKKVGYKVEVRILNFTALDE